MEQVEHARSSGGTPAVVDGREVPWVAKQPRFVGALAETLLGGGVALVHSDLGYVVLAHALDREGVERVRSMPGLPASPMRLITDPEGAHRVAVVTARARQLIFQTWPGTLALRVPRRRWLPSWAGSRDSVTLLCPDAFLWRTARTVGAPLVFRFALPVGRAPRHVPGRAAGRRRRPRRRRRALGRRPDDAARPDERPAARRLGERRVRRRSACSASCPTSPSDGPVTLRHARRRVGDRHARTLAASMHQVLATAHAQALLGLDGVAGRGRGARRARRAELPDRGAPRPRGDGGARARALGHRGRRARVPAAPRHDQPRSRCAAQARLALRSRHRGRAARGDGPGARSSGPRRCSASASWRSTPACGPSRGAAGCGDRPRVRARVDPLRSRLGGRGGAARRRGGDRRRAPRRGRRVASRRADDRARERRRPRGRRACDRRSLRRARSAARTPRARARSGGWPRAAAGRAARSGQDDARPAPAGAAARSRSTARRSRSRASTRRSAASSPAPGSSAARRSAHRTTAPPRRRSSAAARARSRAS